MSKRVITIFGFIAILVVLSIFSSAGYYTACRLHKGIAAFFPKVHFLPVMIAVAVIILFLLLGFMQSMTPFPKEVKQFFGTVGSYCMGIFIYLFLFTAFADLLFAIPRLMKLSFTHHVHFNGFVSAGVLLLTLFTCIYGFVNARQIDHVSYEIKLEGKKDISDLKMVLISDLHLGSVSSEERLYDIVNEINSLNPDVVCIAGDFFDTDFSSVKNPQKAIETLQKLKSTYGVYACFGNHDGGKTYDEMVCFLDKANINLLDDEYTVIDNRLILIGRLDAFPIGKYGDRQRKTLDEYFTRDDTSLPVVVLDHNPANIHEYTNEADLILCGHTHKGQIFPGSLITNAMYTVDYGYYRKDSNSPHVIVTSGIGTWGMPMRVGTDSEIVSINIS